MKFAVTRTSDYDYVKKVEINTLEELIAFFKENGDIIISRNYDKDILKISDCDYAIEIYDYYRE